MKKYIAVSAILSLLVCAAGCLVNYRSYQSYGHLKWALRTYGGEITIENGFGWHLVHIYSMTPDTGDSIRCSFSVPGMLVSFLGVFALISVLCVLIRFVRRRSR